MKSIENHLHTVPESEISICACIVSYIFYLNIIIVAFKHFSLHFSFSIIATKLETEMRNLNNDNLYSFIFYLSHLYSNYALFKKSF